mmetsp:Transcript_117200/g.185461  ORF Transcript_117200/g.185461 Transcript_117200/m.185461 type:complete len:429 (+) Transcript_117200:47-1333(+)
MALNGARHAYAGLTISAHTSSGDDGLPNTPSSRGLSVSPCDERAILPSPPAAIEGALRAPVSFRRSFRRRSQRHAVQLEERDLSKLGARLADHVVISQSSRCPSATVTTQTCLACFCTIKPNNLESFCGSHACCTDCATRSATLQVQSGSMPKCFQPDCRKLIDPLVALRLLEPKHQELYLRLALWSNPCIEACPKCDVMLYSDAADEGPEVQCPACLHSFCASCRESAHAEIDCETAAQQRRKRPSNSRAYFTHGDDSDLLHEEKDWKVCPRCRFAVEKLDADSCDHVTCARCHHEFCWSCLADRMVVFAHGNHHHRPSCRFYAPYSGPDEFLPLRCSKCALRGVACRPSRAHATTHGAPQALLTLAAGSLGQRPAEMLDEWVRWIQGAFEISSCTTVKSASACFEASHDLPATDRCKVTVRSDCER